MSLRKLRFSVFVMKTYSGTGKRDFNLGLCFCFFRFCSLPRALASALILPSYHREIPEDWLSELIRRYSLVYRFFVSGCSYADISVRVYIHKCPEKSAVKRGREEG